MAGQPDCGSRRRERVLPQPDSGRRAVPPGGAQRWQHRQLPRWRRHQGDAHRPRVGGVTAASVAAARRRISTGPASEPASTTSASRRSVRSSSPAECSAVVEQYDEGEHVPFDHRHGQAPVRPGPVPLLRATRCLRSSSTSAPRSGPTSCRSRGTGPDGAATTRRGPTTSTSGSGVATMPARPRPTPLMLRYGPGDWNALHRDLYGDLVFPLQVVIGLDEPARRLHRRGVRRGRATATCPVPRHRTDASSGATASSSPPATIRSATAVGGRDHPCATASAPSTPGDERRSD